MTASPQPTTDQQTYRRSTVHFLAKEPMALTQLLCRNGYVLHDLAEPAEWFRLLKGPLSVAVHHDNQAVCSAPDAAGAFEVLELCFPMATPNEGKINE